MGEIRGCYNQNNKFPQKYTPEMIQDLCEEILAFAEEDETVHFVTFARRKKKTSSWINELAKDYPEFDQAYTDAKELMATKLIKSSIYGHSTNDKFNGVQAMSWMRVYSKTYQDYEEWKEKIKQKNLTQEEASIIVQAVNYAKKEN
jgi:predicted adenine nucleotide alpha hydrolase (AANH) superfamily ATPase